MRIESISLSYEGIVGGNFDGHGCMHQNGGKAFGNLGVFRCMWIYTIRNIQYIQYYTVFWFILAVCRRHVIA